MVAAVTADPARAGLRRAAARARCATARGNPAFAARWFADGPLPDALAGAPMIVFDRNDALQDGFLPVGPRRGAAADGWSRPRQTRGRDRARHRLGHGGPTCSGADRPGLVELEPGAATATFVLHLQRWRLRTPSLDRLAEAIVAGARERLAPVRAG